MRQRRHSYIHLLGAIAQLGERLPCKQEVIGSIPFSSTIYNHGRKPFYFLYRMVKIDGCEMMKNMISYSLSLN